MSLLAFSLAAGLVIGDVPASVSTEVEERLDLRGKWEGASPSTDPQARVEVKIWGNQIDVRTPEGRVGTACKIHDEGEGKFRMELIVFGKVWRSFLGIYQWRGDRLVLCLREAAKGRPTRFQHGGDDCLLILRRVEPRK